jgi:hypothetical protein
MEHSDLPRLKAELEINQCHLADVRDAIDALNREWDELQVARHALVNQILMRQYEQEG